MNGVSFFFPPKIKNKKKKWDKKKPPKNCFLIVVKMSSPVGKSCVHPHLFYTRTHTHALSFTLSIQDVILRLFCTLTLLSFLFFPRYAALAYRNMVFAEKKKNTNARQLFSLFFLSHSLSLSIIHYCYHHRSFFFCSCRIEKNFFTNTHSKNRLENTKKKKKKKVQTHIKKKMSERSTKHRRSAIRSSDNRVRLNVEFHFRVGSLRELRSILRELTERSINVDMYSIRTRTKRNNGGGGSGGSRRIDVRIVTDDRFGTRKLLNRRDVTFSGEYVIQVAIPPQPGELLRLVSCLEHSRYRDSIRSIQSGELSAILRLSHSSATATSNKLILVARHLSRCLAT